ncbi:MAG: hypothetical protein ABEK50_16790 [bacterium]
MAEQHGRDKEAEADDPFELVGNNAPGDPEFMARSLMEEYARLGMDRERLMAIFQNEFYQSAHNLYQELGEQRIGELVDEVLEHRAGYEVEIEYTPENMSDSPSPFHNQNGEA